MNLILLEDARESQSWPLEDPRAQHVTEVLGKKLGDIFDVGLRNGPLGKAKLLNINALSLDLAINWNDTPQMSYPVELVVGMSRPQTMRKVLQLGATLGVRAIHCVLLEKSESNYAASTLWSSSEWKRHLSLGAEQAFSTTIPELNHFESLEAYWSSRELSGFCAAFDNYESTGAWGSFKPKEGNDSFILMIGSERGWSAKERDLLRGQGVDLFSLGERVLRTETAVSAALSILYGKLGWM